MNEFEGSMNPRVNEFVVRPFISTIRSVFLGKWL
jgi:hypothetical protein